MSEETSIKETFEKILMPIHQYGISEHIENMSSGSITEQKIFIDEVVPQIGQEMKPAKSTRNAVKNINTIIHTVSTFGLTPVIKLNEKKIDGKRTRGAHETSITVEVGTVFGIARFNIGNVKAKKSTVKNMIKERIKLFTPVNPPRWVVEMRKREPKKRSVVYIIE